MKNFRKIIVALMAAAMLTGFSAVSSFADTPAIPKSLQEISEKYGATVTYDGELHGLPVFEVSGPEYLKEILNRESPETASRASCNHVWFYYWDARRENCIRNPENTHTWAMKRKECSECGHRLNTGDVEIRNCPSGCQLSDYF